MCAQASKHKAIKVAEMAASQGADTIPRVHRFCLESVVHGHHVYKRVWTPVVGEQLPVGVEEDNGNDPRAVAMCNSGIVVGHLPRAQTVYLTIDCVHLFFCILLFASWNYTRSAQLLHTRK